MSNAERLMNLTICLLHARTPMTREQIRQAVHGYSQSRDDVAFERMFERDKKALKAIGVPIQTEPLSAFFDDEVGYRIVRQTYELPDLQFDAAETLALGVAATVWERTRLAEDSLRALGKLRATGVDIDSQRSASLAPRMTTDEPSFDVLKTALQAKQRVTFTYKGLSRVVEPWTMAYRRGNWYLFGFDATRDDHRCFKLARIEDTPTTVGKPGVYDVPAFDEAELLAPLETPVADQRAVVAIRGDGAPALRRHATRLERAAPRLGYTCYEIAYSMPDMFVRDVAEHGADVLLIEPPDLRETLIEYLRGVGATHE